MLRPFLYLNSTLFEMLCSNTIEYLLLSPKILSATSGRAVLPSKLVGESCQVLPGRACRSSHSVFSVVFSENRINTS